jgi:hypothetical protein
MFAVMQIIGGIVGLGLMVFLWPAKDEVKV